MLSLGVDKGTVVVVQLSNNNRLNKTLFDFGRAKLLIVSYVVKEKPSRSNHVGYMRRKSQLIQDNTKSSYILRWSCLEIINTDF